MLTNEAYMAKNAAMLAIILDISKRVVRNTSDEVVGNISDSRLNDLLLTSIWKEVRAKQLKGDTK